MSQCTTVQKYSNIKCKEAFALKTNSLKVKYLNSVDQSESCSSQKLRRFIKSVWSVSETTGQLLGEDEVLLRREVTVGE